MHSVTWKRLVAFSWSYLKNKIMVDVFLRRGIYTIWMINLFCVIRIDCKLDWIWSRSPDEIMVLGVVLPLSELCTLPSSFLVIFHIWRASWKNRISWTTMKLRKLLVKPVTWQNISSCSVLSLELVMHDAFNVILWTSTDICVIVHDDLGWKNRTTRYILPRHWLYEWFSSAANIRRYMHQA